MPGDRQLNLVGDHAIAGFFDRLEQLRGRDLGRVVADVACSLAKLTLASSTPGTFFSAFSTRFAHDAQVMPVIGRSICYSVMHQFKVQVQS